jgi:hypothetical protein
MPRDATVCFCPHNGKDRSDEKGQQRGSSFAIVMQLDIRLLQVCCLESMLKPKAVVERLAIIFHTCEVEALKTVL